MPDPATDASAAQAQQEIDEMRDLMELSLDGTELDEEEDAPAGSPTEDEEEDAPAESPAFEAASLPPAAPLPPPQPDVRHPPGSGATDGELATLRAEIELERQLLTEYARRLELAEERASAAEERASAAEARAADAESGAAPGSPPGRGPYSSHDALTPGTGAAAGTPSRVTSRSAGAAGAAGGRGGPSLLRCLLHWVVAPQEDEHLDLLRRHAAGAVRTPAVENKKWCRSLAADGTPLGDGERNAQGEPHGRGTMVLPHGAGHYVGEWRKGAMEGEGRFYGGGERYVGQFVGGLRSGKGVYFYDTGDRFEGAYARGVRHGAGVMLYANGDRCEGCWAAGSVEGTAEYSFASGAVELGRYQSGAEAGEGVAWSLGREQAWKTWDGVRREAVSLQEASEVAARLKGGVLRAEDAARAASLLEEHAAGPASPRKPPAVSRHASPLRGVERAIAPPSSPAHPHLPLPDADPASRPVRRELALPSCCNGTPAASEPPSAPSQSSRYPGTPTELGESSLGESSLGESSLGESSPGRDAWWHKRPSARASPMPQRALAPPQGAALHPLQSQPSSPDRMCLAQQPAWAPQQPGADAASPVEGHSPTPLRPPRAKHTSPSYPQASPVKMAAQPAAPFSSPLVPPVVLLEPGSAAGARPSLFLGAPSPSVEAPGSEAAEEEAIIQRLYDEERLAMRRSMSREDQQATTPELL